MNLIQGDAIELASLYIPDRSVDLIFTDPPYSRKYHHLYKWLAQEGSRVLKPDGFLFVYTPPYWKDKLMRYFDKHLDYFYDFILIHKGNTSILWQKKVISGYKSILCYRQKGSGALPHTNVLGKWNGSTGDKRFHKWGQSEVEAKYYIDCFSKPGDVVFDVAKSRIKSAIEPEEKGLQQVML